MICLSCKNDLPEKNFELQKNRPNRRKECKQCRYKKRDFHKERIRHKEYAKKWYSQRKNVYKQTQLKIKYGLEYSTYRKIIEYQNNKCAICHSHLKGGKETHVDHCHKSGKVRGILCSKCNSGIGMLGDSKEILFNAIKYLDGPHYELTDCSHCKIPE